MNRRRAVVLSSKGGPRPGAGVRDWPFSDAKMISGLSGEDVRKVQGMDAEGDARRRAPNSGRIQLPRPAWAPPAAATRWRQAAGSLNVGHPGHARKGGERLGRTVAGSLQGG